MVAHGTRSKRDRCFLDGMYGAFWNTIIRSPTVNGSHAVTADIVGHFWQPSHAPPDSLQQTFQQYSTWVSHLLPCGLAMQASAGGGGSDLLETPSMTAHPSARSQYRMGAPESANPPPEVWILAGPSLQHPAQNDV